MFGFIDKYHIRPEEGPKGRKRYDALHNLDMALLTMIPKIWINFSASSSSMPQKANTRW
jgi:hypothetical protein